jgi:hypothetical protein
MTCIVATHPFWQYILMSLGFALATWGVGYFVIDQWRIRHQVETRWAMFVARHTMIPRSPLLWWDRRAHYVIVVTCVPIMAMCAWVTVAVMSNTVIYARVLLQGMPRC